MAGGLEIYVCPATAIEAGRGIPYPPGHALHRVRLDRTADLLGHSHTLSLNADITQSANRVAQVGKLSLELDNNNGRWADILGDITRGHIVEVESDRQIIWRGFSREVVIGNDDAGSIKLTASHDLDRLNDLDLAAAPDFPAENVDVILDDLVRRTIPEMPQIGVEDVVFRPPENTDGRSYLGSILLGLGKILYLKRDGMLGITDFGGAGAPMDLTDEDVVSVRQIDEKHHMYNRADFEFWDAENSRKQQRTWRGAFNPATAPELYRRAFGVRELRIDLTPFGESEAEQIAERIIRRAMIPRRRLAVEIAAIDESVEIGNIIDLDLAHINQNPLAVQGQFWVVGLAVDLRKQTTKVELIEVE